jgi:signal transduction histidine kinase
MLWNCGVLISVLAAFALVLRGTAQTVMMESVDRKLADRAIMVCQKWGPRVDEVVHPIVAASVPSQQEDPPPDLLSRHAVFRAFRPDAGHNDRRYAFQQASLFMARFLATAGFPIQTAMSMSPWDGRTFRSSARGRSSYSTISVDNERYRIYSMPFRRHGQVLGVLQVAEPLGEIELGLAGITGALLMMAPLAALISWLGGAFLTGRALRPVSEITRAAGEIGAGNLSGRLPVHGGDEFSRLAGTMNGMLDRLEHAFGQLEKSCEAQRRFTGDVSHELRTPLTVIMGNTSLALDNKGTARDYRSALLATDRAAMRMNQTIQDLLLLARADSGQLAGRLTPVQIAGIMETASESFNGRIHAPIHLQLPEVSCTVLGESGQLVRLFTNLIENAVRCTPLQGEIHLVATTTEEYVDISVGDTGVGISPEHLPHLRERFYRVDDARTRGEGGAGLGLSICQSIVDAHGGNMSIESIVGYGTTVRITLRRALLEAGNGATN